MTIRKELELLGPDAVRRGMTAFESGHEGRECGIGVCCFMAHIAATPGSSEMVRYSNHSAVIQLLGCRPFDSQRPSVETNYENWSTDPNFVGGREVLRQECIAFLAEHGTAVERPVEVVVSP